MQSRGRDGVRVGRIVAEDVVDVWVVCCCGAGVGEEREDGLEIVRWRGYGRGFCLAVLVVVVILVAVVVVAWWVFG